MAIRVLKIPPDQIRVDEDRFPDRDNSWIYEHLRHYCSLFDPLPAITVLVEASPVVTRGHKYLRIARELHRPQIRAVVDPASDPSAVSSLDSRPDIETLDWKEIENHESVTPVVENWHVFYFGRALDDSEKAVFNHDIGDFFESLHWATYGGAPRARIGEVLHDDEERRAEFLARTPVADESWYPKYLAAVTRFSREVAPVVSYQGRRFGELTRPNQREARGMAFPGPRSPDP